MDDVALLKTFLNIDWTRAQVTDARYKKNRTDWWQYTEVKEGRQLMVIGEDTDGDGTVDFIHADTTGSGLIDFSAYYQDGRWQLTNLVEAWLEVNFSLPWARDTYIPHNTDIRFNGVIIASFKDSLPEGHYAFPIPPKAMRFPGDTADNLIEIVSEHLRGGHYIVTSDFQVLYRLTIVDTFVVAESREAAEQKVFSTPGFRFKGGDLAVNSNGIILSKTQEIAPGERLEVRANIYNLGMDTVRDITVAFVQSLPGGYNPVEISRVTLPEVTLYNPTVVAFSWMAAPGAHALNIIIDPDNTMDDNSRFNNKALINVVVPGKDAVPQVEIASPQVGQIFKSPEVLLRARGVDETGVLAMAYRIDDGIWIQRQGVDSLNETITIQPGTHTIRVRATDCSGNASEDFRAISVEVAKPEFNIIEPVDGFVATSNKMKVVVELTDPALIKQAQVSIGDGAWQQINLDGNALVSEELPLEFGKQILQFKVTDYDGVESVATRVVECIVSHKRKENARIRCHAVKEP